MGAQPTTPRSAELRSRYDACLVDYRLGAESGLDADRDGRSPTAIAGR